MPDKDRLICVRCNAPRKLGDSHVCADRLTGPPRNRAERRAVQATKKGPHVTGITIHGEERIRFSTKRPSCE